MVIYNTEAQTHQLISEILTKLYVKESIMTSLGSSEASGGAEDRDRPETNKTVRSLGDKSVSVL